MQKQVTRQIFGVPSVETVNRIDASDKINAMEAAHYRCAAKMRELEIQFEVKATAIRQEFLAECASIMTPEEGEAE